MPLRDHLTGFGEVMQGDTVCGAVGEAFVHFVLPVAILDDGKCADNVSVLPGGGGGGRSHGAGENKTHCRIGGNCEVAVFQISNIFKLRFLAKYI